MRVALGIACVLATGCGRAGFDDDPPTAFTAFPLPQGGSTGPIVRASDGTLYVGLSGARVVRSRDRGASWQPCGRVALEVDYLVVDPASGALWTAGTGGVATSSDGCASWHDTGLGRDASGIALLGSQVYTGADDGLYRRTGATWLRVGTQLDGSAIWEVAADAASGTVIATGPSGVVRSDDGGATWQLASATGGFYGLVLAPGAADALAHDGFETYHSSDRGSTWASVEEGAFGYAYDPADPTYVVQGSWEYGIDVSSDGGVTWDLTDRRSADMQLAHANALVFGSGGELFAATNRGVYYAPDRALAWQERDAGIDAWQVGAVAENGNGVLLLGTGAGVLRSADGGRTWTEETAGMSIDSNTVGVIAADNDPDAIAVVDEDSVALSSDQGFTFDEVYTFTQADGYHPEALVEYDGELVVASDGGVEVSSDWVSFAHYDVAGQTRSVRHLTQVDAGGTLIAATESGAFVSADGGMTWQDANAGLSTTDTCCASALADGSLVLGTAVGAFHAAAPGQPWAASGLPGVAFQALLAAGTRVYAATDAGVFVTRDGASWAPVLGLEDARPCTLAVDRDGRLLVGTYGHGLFSTPL